MTVRVGLVMALTTLSLECEAATDPVHDALNRGRWQARERAIETLKRRGDRDALLDLARTHRAIDVRRGSLRALGEILEERQSHLIRPFLAGSDRGTAVAALGEIGVCDGAHALLQDALPDVRRHAASALGRCLTQREDAATLARLVDRLDDGHRMVREAAAAALATSPWGRRRLVNVVRGDIETRRSAAVRALAREIRQEEVDEISVVLASLAWPERAVLVDALAGLPAGRSLLRKRVGRESHPFVRRMIERALETDHVGR